MFIATTAWAGIRYSLSMTQRGPWESIAAFPIVGYQKLAKLAVRFCLSHGGVAESNLLTIRPFDNPSKGVFLGFDSSLRRAILYVAPGGTPDKNPPAVN